MNIRIDTSEIARDAAGFSAMAGQWMKAKEKVCKTTGLEAVTFIQKRFRTGGSIRPVGFDAKGRQRIAKKFTTDTRTAVRTGRLRGAYDSRVAHDGDSTNLDVGLVKPGENAEVLLYGRMQEGIARDGSTFTSMKIKAKNVPYLRFRLPDGQWVATKEVTFKPRPSFPTVQEKLPPVLQSRLIDALAAITAGKQITPSGQGIG